MKFKIRASAASEIMTNDRSGKSMGETAKKYCQVWLKEKLYNRRKDISTWSMQKGLIMEDEAIDLVADYFDLGFLVKNEQYFENDFLTGTPDVILPDQIIDIKCSWDAFTFPLFETEPPKSYWWQGQVYMELTGRDHFNLVYCLMDTPHHMIYSAAWRYARDNGFEQLESDIYERFEQNMTYKDIPLNLRIKSFTFDRDASAIVQLQARVQECQQYINSIR